MAGSSGGITSGVGPTLTLDTRDYPFAPLSGVFVRFVLLPHHGLLLSEHDFLELIADARGYVGLGGEHVLAARVYYEAHYGDVPFDRMAIAGGAHLLRGYPAGRYRDDHLVAAQLEYRFPVYWRFGAAVFAETGQVAGTHRADVAPPLVSGGGGVRLMLSRDRRITARADVAFSPEDWNVYLWVGEAF